MVFTTSFFSLYFGNASRSIFLSDVDNQRYTKEVEYAQLQVQANEISLLKQEHGDQGHIIQVGDRSVFHKVGDYLMTDQVHHALGVVTADCVPLLFYDQRHHAVAVVHAGWKGTYLDIVQKTLYDMNKTYGTKIFDLLAYVGPSARLCCYQVGPEFYDRFIAKDSASDSFFVKRQTGIYFDNAAYILFLLEKIGIRSDKLYTMYNICTICDKTFCSYRRDKDLAKRQITLVSLMKKQ